ncbi:MAG: two-component system, NtrC family, C4-dicarboxylate transport sensor histidine kinase DctB [Campylobacterota bacterium]|nr:two-component system, NtrC family, C4-dicarboxylate transport sensor histidine kinase DctB [Campylobacterota bacterium]
MLDGLKIRIFLVFFISLIIFCATLITGYKKYTEQSSNLENYLHKQYAIHGNLYKARSEILLLENMFYKRAEINDSSVFKEKIEGIKDRLSTVGEMMIFNSRFAQNNNQDTIFLKINQIKNLLDAKKNSNAPWSDELEIVKREFDTLESIFLYLLDDQQKTVIEDIEGAKIKIIAYSTIVMVILFLFLIYAAAVFLKPILKLNKYIEDFAKNEFDIKRRIPISDSDIGNLAQSFNKFLDKVQDMDEKLILRANELEKRVKEEIGKNREKDVIMIKQSQSSAISEMIENIAHQWRQPLNALGLTVQDIEDAYDFDELNEEYVRNSVRRAMDIVEKMSKSVDKFRDFYLPKIERREFSINNTIDETLRLFDAVFKENFIVVRKIWSEDVTTIGYPNEFSQVIFNILNNSKEALVDYQDKLNREIIIKLTKDGDLITLLIADNGGGIKTGQIDRIFDPYYTTKEKTGGVGLGLYMSKTIIEKNMDGKISAYNTPKGAAIKIELNSL